MVETVDSVKLANTLNKGLAAMNNKSSDKEREKEKHKEKEEKSDSMRYLNVLI